MRPRSITATSSHSRSTTSSTCEVKKSVTPPRGEPAQQVAHHAPRDGVDPVERLVEEEHRGPVDERAGERELLAHALRVVHHQLAALVGEREELEQLLGAPPRLGAREAVHARGEEQVLLAGQALVEGQLLGQDADLPLQREEVAAESRTPSITASPAVGRRRPGEHRIVVLLPAPFGPEEAEEAAAGHAEGHVVHRRLPAERLRQALDHDRVASRAGRTRCRSSAQG